MKPIVLITGASSGLGYEFAKIFAENNYDLIITAAHATDLFKAKGRLEDEYGAKVWAKTFDLGRSGAAGELYKWSKQIKRPVSVLVNNAGIGLYGDFVSHDLRDEQELLNLNIVALSELCHFYMSDMLKQRSGKVLNISSVAAFQAGAYYATYFASKAYVLLFSEALQLEYEDKNIQVTTLCPGVTKTRFFERAKMREDSKMLQKNLMDPSVVAQAGYDGLMSGKKIVIPGFKNKITTLGYRILPRSVINKITRGIIREAA